MRLSAFSLLLIPAMLALSGCGGGAESASASNPAGITRVVSFGDSLSELGMIDPATGKHTPGTIATTTGSTDEPRVIWTERTAAALGAPGLCSHYVPGQETVMAANCTSYAKAGARVNNPGQNTTSVKSIQKQLKDAAAQLQYGSGDIVLIDGAGNDAADLSGAYIAANQDGGAALKGLIGSLSLIPALAFDVQAAATAKAVETAMLQGNTPAAGVAYMQTIAHVMASSIEADLIAKGATRVAVLNAPGITNTPRFKMVLEGVNQATIAGAKAKGADEATATTAGQNASIGLATLIDTWVKAYNATLQARLGGNSKVAVIDFYSAFNDQIVKPAQYGLTNVKDTACPITGKDSSGLPDYTFATCTADALNKTTPGWQRYGFSDGFHPTPYGHQLMAQLVSLELSKKGWQ